MSIKEDPMSIHFSTEFADLYRLIDDLSVLAGSVSNADEDLMRRIRQAQQRVEELESLQVGKYMQYNWKGGIGTFFYCKRDVIDFLARGGQMVDVIPSEKWPIIDAILSTVSSGEVLYLIWESVWRPKVMVVTLDPDQIKSLIEDKVHSHIAALDLPCGISKKSKMDILERAKRVVGIDWPKEWQEFWEDSLYDP